MTTQLSRAIIYARKSTESEDRQVLSIESQISELDLYAQKTGLHIAKVCRESQSAKSPGRPVFEEMMHDLGQSEPKSILCWSLDRLARNPIDGARLIWAIEKGDVLSISTPRQTFHNTSNDKFWMNLEFGMAKKYIDDLSENVKRGLRMKLRQGWQPCLPPVGYLNDSTTGTIVSDPVRFPIVRQMWDMLLDGSSSVHNIWQTAIKQWGLTPRLSRNRLARERSLSGIYSLFHNPFYYGLIRSGGAFYPGAHVAMVSKAEFDRAQSILAQRHRPQPKHHHFTYKGLMNCGQCGGSVTAENKVNRYGYHYIYYHCTRRSREIVCSQPSIEEKDLELQIRDYLKAGQLFDQGCSIERRNLLNRSGLSFLLLDKKLVVRNYPKALASDH